MIVDMHCTTPRYGIHHIQAWIDSDGWLYLRSSIRDKSSPIMDVSGMSHTTVAEQIASVYNSELGHIVQHIRHGSTLEMLVALYRNKTEDPD